MSTTRNSDNNNNSVNASRFFSNKILQTNADAFQQWIDWQKNYVKQFHEANPSFSHFVLNVNDIEKLFIAAQTDNLEAFKTTWKKGNFTEFCHFLNTERNDEPILENLTDAKGCSLLHYITYQPILDYLFNEYHPVIDPNNNNNTPTDTHALTLATDLDINIDELIQLFNKLNWKIDPRLSFADHPIQLLKKIIWQTVYFDKHNNSSILLNKFLFQIDLQTTNEKDFFAFYQKLESSMDSNRRKIESNDSNEQLIKWTILFNQVKIFESLVNYNATHWLMVAILHARFDIVRSLVEKNSANINAISHASDYRPIFLAVLGKHYDIVKYLIAQGADLNVTNGFKENLLHLVAQRGHVGIARLLLEAGLKGFDQKDDMGKTPVEVARAYNNAEMIELFSEYQQKEIEAVNDEEMAHTIFSKNRLGFK